MFSRLSFVLKNNARNTVKKHSRQMKSLTSPKLCHQVKNLYFASTKFNPANTRARNQHSFKKIKTTVLAVGLTSAVVVANAYTNQVLASPTDIEHGKRNAASPPAACYCQHLPPADHMHLQYQRPFPS